MPYATPNGPIYDSGDFRAVLDRALALADWSGFAARRRTSKKAGRLRGIVGARRAVKREGHQRVLGATLARGLRDGSPQHLHALLGVRSVEPNHARFTGVHRTARRQGSRGGDLAAF